MNVTAIKCPSCKDLVFSRARHDFRWCSCEEVAVDGGLNYIKISFKKECPERIIIEINQTTEELHKDWSSQKNKFGIIKEAGVAHGKTKRRKRA